MEILPATLEDFVALYGHAPPYSFQGFTVHDQGQPVGMGGLYYSNGALVVFSRINAVISRRVIVQVCRKVMTLARERGAQVYAMRDPAIATSAGLLAHFGFEQIEDSEVYLWLG